MGVGVNAVRASLGIRPLPVPVAGALRGVLHCTGPLERPVFSGTAVAVRPPCCAAPLPAAGAPGAGLEGNRVWSRPQGLKGCAAEGSGPGGGAGGNGASGQGPALVAGLQDEEATEAREAMLSRWVAALACRGGHDVIQGAALVPHRSMQQRVVH